METKNYPLISALCVTRAKPDLLQRAISCFLSQTYKNKELVVVYDSDDLETKEFVASFQQNSIISFYEVEKTKSNTLGYLRNYAIEKSNGAYVCQWDDDDWYHIARIEYLYEAICISGFPAAIVTQWLIFNSTNNKAYVSHKRLWEGSLLCEKTIIHNIGYDHLNIGEDTSLIERLEKECKLYHINDTPNLYVYIYHAKNTWNYKHWEMIFDYSFELSLSDSKTIKNILKGCHNMEEKSIEIDNLLENPLMVEENTMPAHKIPKVIHFIQFTFKNYDAPDEYKMCIDKIKKLHPDWEINIYNDADAKKIVEDFFPEMLNIYNAYPCDIQRVDIFRILIIYLKGGFYLDLDVYLLKELDELRHLNLVLGEERTITPEENKKLNLKSNLQIANYMFGSIPKHPFWLEVLLESINRSQHEINEENDILYTTGPWLLTKVYQDVKHKYNDIELIRNKFRICLVHCQSISCRFGDFAAHLHKGSWRWQSENRQESSFNTSLSIECVQDTHTSIAHKIKNNRFKLKPL